jgi:hypothetical protein
MNVLHRSNTKMRLPTVLSFAFKHLGLACAGMTIPLIGDLSWYGCVRTLMTATEK